MDRLTPNYLKAMPTCPSVCEASYTMKSASNPDAYTVECASHHTRYTSTEGLIVPDTSEWRR